MSISDLEGEYLFLEQAILKDNLEEINDAEYQKELALWDVALSDDLT